MTHLTKRVVVILDAVSETRAAIDTASRLAAHWRVPLHGRFVEDEELIGFARLPFARQVSLTAGLAPLTQDHLEGHYRALCERARRDLAAAAKRHSVEWSFEVVRGPPASDASGSVQHDFIVASGASRPVATHFRMPSRWSPAIATVSHPFLLAKCAWETGGSVLTLLRSRGSEAAKTLDVAAQLARLREGKLTVTGTPDVAQSDDFAAWVSDFLEEHWPSLRAEFVATELIAVEERVIELDCRLLVIEGGNKGIRLTDQHELFDRLTCDVLIIP